MRIRIQIYIIATDLLGDTVFICRGPLSIHGHLDSIIYIVEKIARDIFFYGLIGIRIS